MGLRSLRNLAKRLSMLIRDRYSQQTPVLWGGAVVPGSVKTENDNLQRRCGYLRTERDFSLAFSVAFVAASGIMAKAVHGRIPEFSEDNKELYTFLSKVLVLVPVGIAALFFKSAYQSNLVYGQCLQDPQGTLARIAAEERVAEEKSSDTKRASLNISEVAGPAGWLVGAGVAARMIAYYGVAVAEGALATGLALCSPGLRYFSVKKRDDAI